MVPKQLCQGNGMGMGESIAQLEWFLVCLLFSLRIAKMTQPPHIPRVRNRRPRLLILTCQWTLDTSRDLHKLRKSRIHPKIRVLPPQALPRPSLHKRDRRRGRAPLARHRVALARFRHRYKPSYIPWCSVYLCWKRLFTQIAKPISSHLPLALYHLFEQFYLRQIA